MADVKISQLPAATTPLDGTELTPIVQSGTTKRVSVANLTVGRALTASSLTLSTPLSAANGGTGLTSLGTGIATFLGTPTSANLAAAVTDETGTGALVFGTTPTFTTSALFPAGTVSAPGISVSGDTNTGIYFPAADTIGFVEGGVESMRLDSSGNLGLGTTGPIVRLHTAINSSSTNTSFLGNQNTALLLQNTSNTIGNGTYIANSFSTGAINAYIGFVNVDQNYASAITFGTAVSGASDYGERMRIDSSGNLLVGTTSTISSSRAVISKGNDAQLTVNASDSGSGVYSTISFANQGVVKTQIYWLSSNDRFIIQNGTGGVYLARDGTTWTANSDERVKIINEPISDAINKVNQLRSVIGRYKNDAQDKRRAFLIAQDVQSVLPEAVDDRDPELLGVSYTDVIPLLVASIKELAAKVSALEAKQ